MTREYHRWFSNRLHRDMELLMFGHDGPPMLVFPSSMGAFFEYEDCGMVGALTDKLDHGALRLFCLSSVDRESWYDKQAHPFDRIRRHLRYEEYILNEVVPFVRHRTWAEHIGVTGCSFGAYHAMVLVLRHPHRFTSCIAMGGAFDIGQFLDGYFDTEAYLLNPPSFLPNLNDPNYLDQYRRNKFVLATGDRDICRSANEAFSELLWRKGIPHSLHVWHDSEHDWPYWRPMAAAYVP